MSYKDELKKQIEELEISVDVDRIRLNALKQELLAIQMKEKTEAPIGQQLLQG